MSQPIPKQGEFCWNELRTNDTASAKTFYHQLFDWDHVDVDMDGSTYTMFKTDDNEGIGGMMQIPDTEQMQPHWMSYITVDDVDAMVDKATQLGATIVIPKTAAGEHGTFAVIADPTGAQVAFWQTSSTCAEKVN